ncbi:MAG TPA: tyrosine--tRNA ligase [Acidimicrobiales bacterium]|nr:tyrosine--tRNA ligase [Acidimicrobiales bacterium]
MAEPVDILSDLEARGLVHDVTDRAALADRLASGPVTVYYGCDPTAPSLHVGNLIGLLVLRRLAAAGHRPVALAGGATGMVGDPSGRSEERNLLDAATLDRNLAAIADQMRQVLADPTIEVVDNRTWTEPMSVIDFLRDVGKHATVNQMLARESVKARLASEHGISFTEFSYMLLQANDYLWLHDHRDCELQIGGSDQWGNILGGVDLIRRTRGHAVHALSWPLLTAPDGTKLGKTTGARVWLDPARTSPYQFHQYWMQTDDRQVEQFLLQFTLLTVDEAREVAAAHAAEPRRRQGQRRLAREATELVHGPGAARTAEEVADVLFGRPLDQVGLDTLEALAREIPTVRLDGDGLRPAMELDELLATSGLVASRSEGRRTLAQGGVYVNNVAAAPGASVGPDDLLHGRFVLLRKGKRTYALVDAAPTST